jgi:hypothetical protein
MLALGLAASCGDEEESNPLAVAWVFSQGDCASSGVETVRVTWTPTGGAGESKEFACTDGRGELGVVPGGSYAIQAEGLDAGGNVVAENFGTTTSFGDIGPFGDLEVTLHPKSANVTVSWTLSTGGTCPAQVTLPFFITLYNPPADGETELTDKVTEKQESCASGQTTLERVAPGDYVVELDSRAVTPKVRGTAEVTVEPGQDATVSIDF